MYFKTFKSSHPHLLFLPVVTPYFDIKFALRLTNSNPFVCKNSPISSIRISQMKNGFHEIPKHSEGNGPPPTLVV
jgi:hypothetical protein